MLVCIGDTNRLRSHRAITNLSVQEFEPRGKAAQESAAILGLLPWIPFHWWRGPCEFFIKAVDFLFKRCPLGDQFALEFRQGCKDPEHQPSVRRRRIDLRTGACQHLQPHFAAAQIVHRRY